MVAHAGTSAMRESAHLPVDPERHEGVVGAVHELSDHFSVCAVVSRTKFPLWRIFLHMETVGPVRSNARLAHLPR